MIKQIYKQILKSPYKRQLLPAFSIVLLAAGCGKKPNNTGGSTDDNVQLNPGLKTNLITLKVNFGPKGSFKKFFHKLSKDALVTIPDKVNTTLGSPDSYLSKITFNKGNQLEEFYCKYESILDQFSVDKNQYINSFKGCFQDTQNDDDMSNDEEQNYFPGQTIPHKAQESLEIELLEFKAKGQSEAKVNIEVDWF